MGVGMGSGKPRGRTQSAQHSSSVLGSTFGAAHHARPPEPGKKAVPQKVAYLRYDGSTDRKGFYFIFGCAPPLAFVVNFSTTWRSADGSPYTHGVGG